MEDWKTMTVAQLCELLRQKQMEQDLLALRIVQKRAEEDGRVPD